MPLLVSCANNTKSSQVISVEVPKSLLVHNQTSSDLNNVFTNADLLFYARECTVVLQQCNADKDRIGSIK